MNVFEAVKQSVTTRQAASYYGIRVGRNGMACCPFHNDRTPSMKVDSRYYLICPLSSRQVKYLKVSDKNTYISFWSVGIFMHTISLYIF